MVNSLLPEVWIPIELPLPEVLIFTLPLTLSCARSPAVVLFTTIPSARPAAFCTLISKEPTLILLFNAPFCCTPIMLPALAVPEVFRVNFFSLVIFTAF